MQGIIHHVAAAGPGTSALSDTRILWYSEHTVTLAAIGLQALQSSGHHEDSILQLAASGWSVDEADAGDQRGSTGG